MTSEDHSGGPSQEAWTKSLVHCERKNMAIMDYRTQDGLAGYGFSIGFQPDAGWRIGIIFNPFTRAKTIIYNWPHQSIDRNGRRPLGRAIPALPAHPPRPSWPGVSPSSERRWLSRTYFVPDWLDPVVPAAPRSVPLRKEAP